METLSNLRFSPQTLGHLQTRNRIVVPPMASQTASELGFVTPKTIAHYERLAQSRAGIVMVEYTHIHPTGRSEENQLSAESDEMIPGLRDLAAAIHAYGALTFLQLTHSLAKSSADLTGGVLYGASAIAVPVKDRETEIPVVLTEAQLADLEPQFLAAARRAHIAGFDGVELHSAHGYGLNQILSPITNQRTDSFGGSLENRAKLLLETVSEIKKQFPRLLVSVRIPGQDNLTGGLTVQDMQWVAKKLQERGIDLINVSSGLGGWRRPGDRSGEGYLVGEAQAIASAVTVPVMGVGGIESAQYIEESLAARKFSLAAVGRAILKDPQDFARKILTAGNEKKRGNTNEHSRIGHQQLFSSLHASGQR